MPSKLKLPGIAGALTALAPLAAAAAPLSAYGSLPVVEQVAISPDGARLALDFVKDDARKIVVQDLAAGKPVTGINAGPAKIRALLWAGNDHLIVVSSVTSGVFMTLTARSEWFTATDLNIQKKTLKPLLQDVDRAGNMIYRLPEVRIVGGVPQLFLVGSRFEGVNSYTTLFRVNLDLDKSYVVMDAPADLQTDYLVGSDGKPLALEQYDAPSRQWSLKLLDNGGWRQVQARTATLERPQLRGIGADGRSILIGEMEDKGYVIRELSLPDGRLGDPLPAPSNAVVLADPTTGRMTGTAAVDGEAVRFDFVDPQDQLRWRAVAAAFKGAPVTLVSESDDHQRVVVRTDSPTQGPAYALVDLAHGYVAPLGAEYPALSSADIAPRQPIRFKAADGLELTGYLTLPRGRDPRQLPLVVLPHGGPAARDEPGFDWWAEAIASGGYAVLQVNYRGSHGFGWPFESAGFGEWGGKMQSDLSDGVRWLAGQGMIDPARVCIVGGSYGGYAALAGVALQPGVYRCAVSVAGPSDLARLIGWEAERQGRQGLDATRYWDRYMGAKTPSDPHLRAISPADHADQVAAPVLLIHGKDDTVVPFEQSQIMLDALRKAGKSADLVVLNHEDHWLSQGATRLQMLQATMDFLQKNNPPG